MLLSIGMMVKNEEKYLDKCLSSLRPILENLDSELIIIDTGSTDNTVEIAKKYTDKVYFHNWNNNFSEMRNITINYCTGDWFFYVDGDEILEDCDDIIDFFKLKIYKNYNSGTIYIKSLIDINNETRYSIFPALRLFKKEKDFKFINAVHNQPVYKGPIKTLSTNCKHYGYISTDKQLMERKFNRTASILKKELDKDPNNVYYLYQLSVSYGMHKDYIEALDCIKKAYNCIIKKKEDIKRNIYVFPQLCSCYLNIKDYINLEKYAKETLKYDKSLIDIYFYLGVASTMLKKNNEAISSFELYVKLYENYYKKERNISIIDYTLDRADDVYYMLYTLNMQINAYDKAQKYLLSINDSKHDVPENMVRLCIGSKEYFRAKKYEENLILKNKLEEVNKFHDALESAKMVIDHEEAISLTNIFSSGDEPYNKLNCIRLKFENEKNGDIIAIKCLLEKIDLSSQPFYYGDLVYYMICSKSDLSSMLERLSFEKINEYLEYLIKKYKDFNECVYAYILELGNKEDFYSIRINKELCRYLIILNNLDKDKLKGIYDYYLEFGIKYVTFIYSDFMLKNECWQSARTEEDRFFIYINNAKLFELSDKKTYIHYLRAALEAYPYMKDVIEYLLNKVKQQISSVNSELESYKIKVKSTIKSLIEDNKLEEAISIINEYEEIVHDDIEIVLLKSQITLKKISHASSNDAEEVNKFIM